MTRSLRAAARLRRRFVVAMGLPALAAAPFACVEQPTLVAAPLYEGDAAALVVAIDAGRLGPAPTTSKIALADPPEPVAPGYSYAETRECRDDLDVPARPELPSPFDNCPRRSPSGGQFSAKATRASRASAPDVCCYVTFVPRAVPGRALRDAEGAAVVAETVDRGDWSAALAPRVAGIPRDVRDALATAWCEDGALEHASVASFARFALELMVHGAPPDLVAAAHAAARDEVEHARTCFALASAYAGRAIGPGALASHRLEGPLDLASFVRRTFADGCVGETIAALEAREASRVARDPVVRRALARIARDEERHAELAWRAVAWAVRVGGACAREALRDGVAAIRVGAGGASGLEAHGRLDAASRRRVAERAIAAIVEPCAAALGVS